MLKSKFLAVLSGVAAVMAAGAASAEIPAASLTALTTSITADVGSVTTWAFGIVGIVAALTIGLKLVKKALNRAT